MESDWKALDEAMSWLETRPTAIAVPDMTHACMIRLIADLRDRIDKCSGCPAAALQAKGEFCESGD